MTRKIVGIVGSYRKGGVIDQVVSLILDSAEKHGAETVKIYLLEKRIEFCTNCRTCTQEKGTDPGRCILTDDMDDVMGLYGESDTVVLGAPVNCFNVNALSRRFIERLLPFSYWPWGQYGPALRIRQRSKRAVLVTSSAMPGSLVWAFTGAVRALRLAAKMMGARPIATIVVGLAGNTAKTEISSRIRRKAMETGRLLAL